jgi:hypothetical protein
MTFVALSYLFNRIAVLRRELVRQRDDGYSTETIAVAALLIALAIAAIGFMADAVINKAKSLDLGGGGTK